jgi:hypothetical protein
VDVRCRRIDGDGVCGIIRAFPECSSASGREAELGSRGWRARWIVGWRAGSRESCAGWKLFGGSWTNSGRSIQPRSHDTRRVSPFTPTLSKATKFFRQVPIAAQILSKSRLPSPLPQKTIPRNRSILPCRPIHLPATTNPTAQHSLHEIHPSD